MKSILKKDTTKRLLTNQKELKRMYLKSIIHNLSLDITCRNNAIIELNHLNQNSSPSRIKNRCILTGTAKSVSRKYKISRMKLRELSLNGYIPGVTRSTW